MLESEARRSLLLILVIYVVSTVTPSASVIVDGRKDSNISATNSQATEGDMIDEYNTSNCGVSDPNYNEHEFVNMAREGQFPWFASFQITMPINSTKKSIEAEANKTISELQFNELKQMTDQHFCCGSFIADRWILSAAHCFASRTIKNYLEHDRLKVVAGSHKVNSRLPINQNMRIKRIFYHASFKMESPIGFDIALVELVDKVKFSTKRSSSTETGEQSKSFINTICLPLKEKHYQANETARVAGWGLSRDKDMSSMPSKLLTTDIKIDQSEQCADLYSKSLNSEEPKIQAAKFDDFLCASHNNSRDACQSDSGGPLMEYANQRAVVIGIVSYGIGCATKGVPGLYTRTSAYITWIRDITKNGKDASVLFQVIEPSVARGKKLARLTKESSIRMQASKIISSIKKDVKTVAEILGFDKRSPKKNKQTIDDDDRLSESLLSPSNRSDSSIPFSDLDIDPEFDKYFTSDFKYFDQ